MTLTAITAPGTYSVTGDCYLANDIEVAGGTALTFTSAGVNLNLNGKTVRNTAPHPTSISMGIRGRASNNLVVVGGSVTGFRFGVHSDTPWTRIEHVDFSACLYIGVHLNGHTSSVISCTADGIGGVTDAAYAIVINVAAGGCIVEGNDFRNIYRQSGAAASLTGEGCPVVINAAAGSCTVRQNHIENNTIADDTIGVFGGSGGEHIIDRNVIRSFKTAVMGGGTEAGPMQVIRNHLWMPAPKTGSRGISSNYGLASENLIVGYETPIGGATPQSGNEIH